MNIKVTKYNVGITILFAAALCIIFALIVNHNRKLREKDIIYSVAQDSIKTYRNKDNLSVSKISVMQAESNKIFLSAKIKDSTIQALQSIIKTESKHGKDVNTAISFKDKTIQNLRDSLKNIIISETIVYRNDSAFIYPVYEKNIADKWTIEHIQIGYNSFKRELELTNEYNIVIGEEPNGIFKRKPYAQITNLNPYSTTQTMKVYQKTNVPNKPLKAGLTWGAVGVGIGALLHFFLK